MDSEIFQLYYIGRTKQIWGEERLANAMDEQQVWKVIITESALKRWFGFEVNPAGAMTLYGVLGIKRETTAEEIKSAYRRMAMQWHPDRCKELNAQETFLRIQEAYEVLSGPKREKYNAGLALESTMKRTDRPTDNLHGYRSPLRCGLIIGEGNWNRGKFLIDNIIAWADLVDGRGRTLVASWKYGDKLPTLVWA